MTARDFDDRTLMAFADGELDDETAVAVEQAMATDDDLAGRVALFLDTRIQAKDALRPLVEEPVPEALDRSVRQMVEAAKSKRGAPAAAIATAGRTRRSVPRRPWLVPLAASLAAIVFGLGGYLFGLGGRDAPQGLAVAGLASPALSQALGRLPSGQDTALAGSGDRLRAVASFRDGAGVLCREFEVDTAAGSSVVSVACRAHGAWSVRFAVVAPVRDGGYAPASSLEALDAYLASAGAHEPLSPTDEAAALAAGR
ncbi:anti-sigma factor family protein [Inquilinus sp.]|jgi:anti-sigma factor RsiW|uniref:anti-sigma factor family protein n=1 Tax=Inquilinus sp. TaxID=1932117 RepID=UPI00378355BE